MARTLKRRGTRATRTSNGTTRSRRLTKARLDQLVEEATVDAHDEAEQALGLLTMIEDKLGLPFETSILGVPVIVEGVQLTGRDDIVAVCRRGAERQAVRLLDLPLPSPPPTGSEWIEAYRHWSREG
jgi:hypothetical protein